MKLVLHATPEEVMRAVVALEKFARAHGVQEKLIFGLALSLEECGSNIVNHALQRDAAKQFQVAFQHDGDEFSIELRDGGPPFDPTTAAPRKLPAEDDDLPGGWGIELVRRHTDEMLYTREGDMNILRLKKKMTASDGKK